MHQRPAVGERYPLSDLYRCDDEIEAAEDWFEERIRAARRDDRLTEPDPDDGRNQGAAGELNQRWWQRPSLCADLAADPHDLVASVEREGNDARLNEIGDNASPPTGAVDRRPSRAAQYITQQIALYRLSLRSADIRLFDPAPAASLAGLPRDVAEDLLMVLRRCDRACIAGVRPLLSILRSVCEPLGDFALSTVSLTQYARRPSRPAADTQPEGARTPTRHRGQSLRCTDINLRYNGREICLLRYERIVLGQDVSAQSGRSIGCSMTLLSEQEDALVAEIARYTERENTRSPEPGAASFGMDALDPSVRRFTQCNPFRSAPEDGCSLEDCFFSDDPDAEGDGADESASAVEVGDRQDDSRELVAADEDPLPVHRRRECTRPTNASGRRRRRESDVVTRR